MQPLLDGDILRYEIGFAAEYGWQGDGENVIPPFDYVQDLLELRINNICTQVEATEKPLIFLTGDSNFRNDVAKTKKYKGNRIDTKKPWHFKNITAFLHGNYEVVMAEGMEADDLMCIEQTSRNYEDTIICSRDKDLHQCPGWHYSWEIGKQPSFGPIFVEEPGWLRLEKNNKKLVGVGSKFFYAQVLTGDVVDNVPGLPNFGPVSAYSFLNGCTSVKECLDQTIHCYRTVYGEDWKEPLIEQAQLLYMVRKLNQLGKPVMWQLPNDVQ